MMLSKAAHGLPDEFPDLVGLHLQELAGDLEPAQVIRSKLAEARLVVVRILGRCGSVVGIRELVDYCQSSSKVLIVISGTGELDPEMTCLSNVDPAVIHETIAYFQAGGIANIGQLFRFLSDHFLLTEFGYDPPKPLAQHGIYHPELGELPTIEEWRQLVGNGKPVVGITFYRAHWLSGNTAFVDAIVEALTRRGMSALPVFTSSLKTAEQGDGELPPAFQFFTNQGTNLINVLINTTSFSMNEVNLNGKDSKKSQDVLALLNVPVLQSICCGATREQWLDSSRGLSPLDTAMNVVLPEFDGRIVTVPISFKQKGGKWQAADYTTLEDRLDRIAGIAWRLYRLNSLANRNKRIAFVFTNVTSKASQIGNAVGLDAPESVRYLLQAMHATGYEVGALPESGTKLIHELIDCGSYDQTYLSEDQCKNALARVSAQQYKEWFNELPQSLRTKMVAQWGEPPGEAYLHDNHLIIAGIARENAVLVLQPPRGYGMDPNAIYHQPDLPPTHHYYALYKWLDAVWQADAIIHVGKHGTLEWLPGKGVGLSSDCFPDALLRDMPLFYPFILNDPGEGAQAKRRAHAVIVDHLTPPMTSAETYGILAELSQLVDEYYQVEMLDPAKLPLLQQQIWDLIKKSNLDQDLKLIVDHHEDGHDDHDDDHDHDHSHVHDGDHDHDHDYDHDHDHEWNDELAPHGVPVSLAAMDGVKVSHLIQDIDAYLCELGAAQIRDGLHTLGQAPTDGALVDMLCSLTRLANLDIPSLQSGVAKRIGFKLEELLEAKGDKLQEVPSKAKQLAAKSLITSADALEFIDTLCHRLYESLHFHNFNPEKIKEAVKQVLTVSDDVKDIVSTLKFTCCELVPNLRRTNEEIENLLNGLNGLYIPPGPSGAPTRGMAHILPTGRNFYSVDPRSLPSQSAWRVGQQLAQEVLRRHLKETGQYPETVAISVWGTSAMRTHGDDIAEIFALLGVRPIWQSENRRLNGIEVIPLEELGRPRIDVTVRISGFFRDAFQHLIDLIDQSVQAVLLRDEEPGKNFVRKHFLEDLKQLVDKGVDLEDAERRASYRIFGSKPGSYGAGILPLINEKNWNDATDFAEAYVNWGGYAYTQSESGLKAMDEFRHRLAKVEIALHNQDNREHDIFDSDDYLQFHGGMIATIKSLTGRRPRHYFGDSQDPARPVIRDLKEEALRVFRTRVVNPKWLDGIKRHGYKGGLELAATVDYLFGYDATSEILDDWMYEDIAKNYALDPAIQEFFSESNPWALNAIAERLLEAVDRRMWSEPKSDTLSRLRQLYLSSEAELEARGELPKMPETAR
ncbi:MAG: cobaltochelatase subunit CobN [Candidatus Melainabacteria bacterium]|nr:MAG: cobaltochelatase subunit CobN [Candidatus Melainabacteria bacterium]